MAARIQLESLMDTFSANPLAHRRQVSALWESNPTAFWREATRILTPGISSQGQKYLISFLLQNAALTDRLCDPEALTAQEARSLARAASCVDPSLEMRLALRIQNPRPNDTASFQRMLEVLEVISEPATLLPVIGNLSHLTDLKARSKAALVVGRGSRSPVWLRQQLLDPDARVRANAVEALWSVTGEEAAEVFRFAAGDPEPRVAANAALALYMAGLPESIDLLLGLIRHRDERFRASGCWAVGRTQDARFGPALEAVAKNPHDKGRSYAVQAIVRIRTYANLLRGMPPLRVRTITAYVHRDGLREISISTTPALALLPTHLVLEEEGAALADWQIERTTPPLPAMIGIALPVLSELDETAATAIRNGFVEALAAKAPGHSWAVVCYSNILGETIVPATPYLRQPAAVERAWDASSKSPLAGITTAIRALLPGPKGSRCLLVVGNSRQQSDAVHVTSSSQQPHLTAAANQAHVPIHALAPPGMPPMSRLALLELCDATRGGFQGVSTTDALPREIGMALHGVFPTHVIRYRPTAPTPAGKLSIRIQSPWGVGEAVTTLRRLP